MIESSLPPERAGFDPRDVTRPTPSLLVYYLTVSLFTGPFFPVTFLPLFFKYQTLRYEFDDQGISMKWGLVFRREIYLTYRRIQDIHLTTNLMQRWFGLATVAIQTASGSTGPEMSIEGILEYSQLRDYLYSQMRGARGLEDPRAKEVEPSETLQPSDEALGLLCEIRDLLQSQVERGEAKS